MMKLYKYKSIVILSCITILTMGLLTQCKEEPVLREVQPEDQVITQYVASNPEHFSEFDQLLKQTGIDNLLSIRGPYTLLLPDNEAMQRYYKKINISSFAELSDSLQKQLVYNHIDTPNVSTLNMVLGAMPGTNALGDFLVTDFLGGEIYINKSSRIKKRNILTSNGYIHILEDVVEPITKSVYDVLAGNPDYSIFTKGLELCGLKDTLQIISFPYGKKIARTRFTILAVSDSVFHLKGINSVNDLINLYTSSPDSITYLNNGFYRYMEYHCLSGTIFLSDFEKKIYPILSYDNHLSVRLGQTIMLNYNTTTKEYTGFTTNAEGDYIDCNINAKNGVIHTLTDLLPVVEPAPTKIDFEVTSYFDLMQGDYYRKYYMKWTDGQNTFAKIKWEADYLQYYYKIDPWNFLKDAKFDCLNLNGFWTIEVTTPKIMKGKYTVSAYMTRCSFDAYIDGVKVNTITPESFIVDYTPDIGVVEWTTTAEHKIKFVAIASNNMFYDRLIFTPKK